MRSSRFRTPTLCAAAVTAVIIIIVTNLFDIPFIITKPTDMAATQGDEALFPAFNVLVIPEVEVYSFKDEKIWNRDYNVCIDIGSRMYYGDFHRVPLESHVGSLSVFTHNPSKGGTSARIIKERKYKPDMLNIILLFLRTEEDVSFIDIGANIGLHSLQVAKYGRKTLAIEASKQNVLHICASVYYGRFQDNLKVIFNAVGRNHNLSKLYLKPSEDFAINSLKYTESLKGSKVTKQYSSPLVELPTFTMDDLLSWSLIDKFKKSFIKLDTEGSELLVLEGADMFFKNTKVIGVLLEWTLHREKQSGASIIALLRKLNYDAFDAFSVKLTRKQMFSAESIRTLFRRLDYDNRSVWPTDVLWMPNT